MLTAVIATHESERALVPTLCALVPGATSGLLTEVIVADAGSKDATAEVADFAGCRFMSSAASLGTRLKAAAQSARTPWLMFLRAGCVPEPGWIEAVDAQMQRGDGQAAVFRAGRVAPSLVAFLRTAFGGPAPAQGLIIARRLYDALGGHRNDDGAEAALLRKLGRRRIVALAASARNLT